MSQLDEIHAMCRQILARLGEAPAVTAGVTYDADETPFLPGTGRPDDPAERARILKLVRASRAASPTQETP